MLRLGEPGSLGMHVFVLQNGKINLLGRYTVCAEGSPLSVEQAQILVGKGIGIPG